MFDIAPEFSALIVFAEHRYYGQSLPFGRDSYQGNNTQYLSSLQALADFAALINSLKAQYGDVRKSMTRSCHDFFLSSLPSLIPTHASVTRLGHCPTFHICHL